MREPTMEKYMTKTRDGYGSGIARPKIDEKAQFELKGQFLKELRDNTFNGSDHEDMLEVILFYKGFEVPTRQILDSKGAIPTMTAVDAKVAIQEMAEHSQKWHDGTSTRTRSTETSDGPAAIQDQLNNLGREIKKMSKVLQERGFGSLPGSTKINPKDHVKSISTTVDADLNPIRRIGLNGYAKGSYGLKDLDACSIGTTLRNDALPQNEKDPRNFSLPCYINNVCFEKALVDLGAIVSVMPFSTYTTLGLGELVHTKLTVELTDRTVKHPKGIDENILVGIGFEHVNANFFPILSINVMSKKFYNSIMKDKVEYNRKNVLGTFVNAPIFVGNFSAVTDFTVVENMDAYHDEGIGEVIVGEPFCKASYVEARRFDGMITIFNGNDSVMSHPDNGGNSGMQHNDQS
ncbi:homeodomain-like protein [Tanacetum coccineum]